MDTMYVKWSESYGRWKAMSYSSELDTKMFLSDLQLLTQEL